MLQKGKQLELTIESLAPGGEGVGKDLSVPIFINKAAPGDRLLVEIFDFRRTFAKAKLLKIIQPGNERVESPCKLFKVCGGCQWLHLSYAAQLFWKKAIIEQALRHTGGQIIGDLCIPLITDVVPAEQKLAYRNKVQLPVRNPQQSKRLLAGYFETNTHNLVNIKHCPIQPAVLDEILAEIKTLAEEHDILAYDENTGQGLLRHIQMRFSLSKEEVLVTLVLNCQPKDVPAKLKKLTNELMTRFTSIKGVSANCNQARGNRILGNETIYLGGQSYIEEVLKSNKEGYPAILQQGLKFQLSPVSFFQVNTAQAITLLELITEEVRDYLKNKQNNKITLLDAYAGVGTIALWLSPFVDKVLAIESNAAAIKDGQINKDLNHIDNVHFHLGKVEDCLPLLSKEEGPIQILVLDPPRQGLDPKVIETLIKMQPDLIIYVSCNPVTLSRDLKLILSDCADPNHGYKVGKIVPVDLFPQTYHIESITVLTKNEPETFRA